MSKIFTKYKKFNVKGLVIFPLRYESFKLINTHLPVLVSAHLSKKLINDIVFNTGAVRIFTGLNRCLKLLFIHRPRLVSVYSFMNSFSSFIWRFTVINCIQQPCYYCFLPAIYLLSSDRRRILLLNINTINSVLLWTAYFIKIMILMIALKHRCSNSKTHL